MSGKTLWRAIATKAMLRVQYLLPLFLGGGGEQQEALASLSKKRGSIESQQKLDFFSYDDTPKL